MPGANASDLSELCEMIWVEWSEVIWTEICEKTDRFGGSYLDKVDCELDGDFDMEDLD